MTIKQFIEKALKGGWMEKYELDESMKPQCGNFVLQHKHIKGTIDEFHSIEFTNENILLDPKAWQAVGKVEGWTPEINTEGLPKDSLLRMLESGAKAKHGKFIDALWEGKSAEEYIKTL